MGPIAESVAELIAAGERAVLEVQREVGLDPYGPADDPRVPPMQYVEALEAKVREQAMALRIAGVTITRQDAPYPAVSRPV